MLAFMLAAATTLAPLFGAASWANAAGPPPTAHRVTVVDVFAFDCINCQHVTPELRRLRAAFSPEQLAIVGVHTPELPEERVHANLLHALREADITWPVVYDDSSRLWNAYGVPAWPTQMVFDKHGRLRATIVGEGQDAHLEMQIAALMAEPA